MCFILLGLNAHPDYPFILAANRDEFYARPAQAAEFWQENPNIFAGRDLQAGGTWLGINRTGRIAALTNFRNPGSHDPRRESRGHIITGWLNSNESTEEYLGKLDSSTIKYNGFSLLAGDLKNIYFYSNCSNEKPILLTQGIYALSNHLLDTAWPKAIAGKQRFENIINSRNEYMVSELLELLSDKTQAPDENLPTTGVGIELERSLSSIFIETPDYGTRCSTVILTDQNGQVEFIERTFTGSDTNTVSHEFKASNG